MARKSKKAVRRKVSKLADEKHVGQEVIDWNSVDDLDKAIYQTLRHYAYYYDKKEFVKWARLWVKENRSDTDYENFCKIEDWRVSPTFAGLCRMVFNGLSPDAHRLAWMHTNVDGAVKVGASIPEDNTNAPPRKSPIDIMRESTSSLIGEIEDFFDKVCSKELSKEEIEAWSMYDIAKTQNLPAFSLKMIKDYYSPIHEEWTKLVAKSDPEILEAHSNVPVRHRKVVMLFLERLLSDVDRYQGVKKAVRKPRAKKEKPVAKLVASVKYQQESDEYKIASVSPTKIVGAKVIILLNTKYKRVAVYHASSKDGMSIRGTTLQDYDATKSFSRTIRKPEDFVNATQKATQAKSLKYIEGLTTKPGDVNGRINGDTIIYKTY